MFHRWTGSSSLTLCGVTDQELIDRLKAASCAQPCCLTQVHYRVRMPLLYCPAPPSAKLHSVAFQLIGQQLDDTRATHWSVIPAVSLFHIAA